MLILDWFRCKGAVWCDLFKVDINHPIIKKANGIYVIWTGDFTERNILKVSNGRIYGEFASARNELAIQAFQHLGVYATWAEISVLKIKKVENFLIGELRPKLSVGTLKGGTTQVNLPWENEQDYRSADSDEDYDDDDDDLFSDLFRES